MDRRAQRRDAWKLERCGWLADELQQCAVHSSSSSSTALQSWCGWQSSVSSSSSTAASHNSPSAVSLSFLLNP